jgi:hypothetical protein
MYIARYSWVIQVIIVNNRDLRVVLCGLGIYERVVVVAHFESRQ